MSLYDLFMKPLEKRGIKKAREHLMKKATGSVLEIGSGTGANIPFYQCDQIDKLVLSDKKLSKQLLKKELHCQTLQELDVTNLPFENDSFDTVVHTLVFCSVDDPIKGINEIKRVLKPNGKLIFIEHVLPDNKLRSLFRAINPLWKRVASGCNLTRDYLELISQEFKINEKNKFMKTIFLSGYATKVVKD